MIHDTQNLIVALGNRVPTFYKALRTNLQSITQFSKASRDIFIKHYLISNNLLCIIADMILKKQHFYTL